MLFNIVSSSRYKFCGTYPIFFCHSFILEKISTLLSTVIVPLLGLCKPIIKFISVLFPDPVLPIKPTRSPLFICKLILFKI